MQPSDVQAVLERLTVLETLSQERERAREERASEMVRRMLALETAVEKLTGQSRASLLLGGGAGGGVAAGLVSLVWALKQLGLI